MSRPATLDRDSLRRHRLKNLVQSVLLILGMLALLAAVLSMLWGAEAVVWGFLGALIGLVLAPNVSGRAMLLLHGARPLHPSAFPEGYALVAEIARRAGLRRPPTLYYLPSAVLNAFAVGRRDDSAIALTDGILRNLTLRELAGVLAHEISHIRNLDLWVMNLADLIGRVTTVMSFVGMLMLVVLLPLILFGTVSFPLLLPVLLLLSPSFVGLLQLALSRTREYDADTDAVGLTGDPEGLASALAKLERIQGRFWERLVFPGRRVPDPSLLRTHPPTDERIRRILSLRPAAPPLTVPSAQRRRPPAGFAPVRVRPHRRWTGAWY